MAEFTTRQLTDWIIGASLSYDVQMAKLGFDNVGEEGRALYEAIHARVVAFDALVEALELILPLAKGYAPEGQSDTAKTTCRGWIEAACAALAAARGEEG